MSTNIVSNSPNSSDFAEKYQQVVKMYNGLAARYNTLLAEYNKLKTKDAENQNQINRLMKQIQEYQLTIECQQADIATSNENGIQRKIDIEDAINSESIINTHFLGY